MKKVRGWGLLTVVVAVALFAAACGDDSGSSSATTAAGGGSASTTAATADTGASTTAGAPVSGTLQGSGSSFSLAYQQEAVVEFNKANPGANVTYGGGGSGKGRTDLVNKTVDFAGFGLAVQGHRQAGRTPSCTSRSCSARSPSRTTSTASTSCSSAATRSPRSSSARSRSGTTRRSPPTTPAPAAVDRTITVAHRSDGSGTTQNFTEYLRGARPRPGR